jgi:hypothetical protein
MAYVGEFSGRRLTIVDVSDPRVPRLRGERALNTQVMGLAITGGHAYMTGLGGHLEVVDVTNPASPAAVAFVAGSGLDVAAAGNTVYVTTIGPDAASYKLRIFDVANPATPALKGEIVIGMGFSSVHVIGTMAYVCTDNLWGSGNWLRLYDVSSPSSPVLKSAVSLGSATFRCFTTDGVHACVGVGDGATSSRVMIYDVSNPAASPVLKGSFAVQGIPSAIARVADVLYLTFYIGSTGTLLLDTLDISDVTMPALRDYTSLGREDGVLIAHSNGYLFIPGRQFDVYATQADLATATLRVQGGLMVDSVGRGTGGLVNGITFGSVSGEGISSQRSGPGGNGFGLDFYTAFQNRLAIRNDGRVGVGHMEPQYSLHVHGSVAGDGAYLNVSDGRYKQQLSPIPNALERVQQLQGVEFHWKRERRDLALPPGRQLGLVAQDVEAIFPEAVATAEDGTKSLAYSALIPVLIEAVKQQQVEIAALRRLLTTRSRAADHGKDVR